MSDVTIREDRRNRQVIVTIQNATYRIRQGLRKAHAEVGKENVRYLRKIIKDRNKTGRIYMIRGRRHQASAPGEPPANLSGDLARSAHYRAYGWERMEFGDRVLYGKYLEKGTRFMAARPHLLLTVRARSGDNYNIYARIPHREVIRL